MSTDELKKTYNQMIDEIVVRLGDDYTKPNILDVLLKYIAEKKLIVGRYKVRDMFDTLCCRLTPSTYRSDMSILCRFPDPAHNLILTSSITMPLRYKRIRVRQGIPARFRPLVRRRLMKGRSGGKD